MPRTGSVPTGSVRPTGGGTLTDRVAAAVREPATEDGYDLHARLDEVLAGVGLSAAEAGGEITFTGADPIVPSTLRLASATALALTAKSVAVAALWRDRGGEGQSISMDLRRAPHRLCPFYDRRWELVNGFPPGRPSDPDNPMALDFYRAGDGRWVMPLEMYPGLKSRTLKLLRTHDDRAAIAEAVARWNGADLEAAGAEAGVVMPMVRSTGEFLAERQYREVLADLPLVEVEKIGDSAPEPLPEGAGAPLAGVRALGMGHVIAGAGVGRALALHGADALNLWRPGEWEHDVVYVTANTGVRSATVEPAVPEGAAAVRALLRGADVFYANRRPGYLARFGLTAHEAAEIRPGVVHTTVTLHGERGPWSQRVGFDQTAGCVTGMMTLEGTADHPRLPYIKVVNDYLVPWLATAGIIAALRRRAREGGSYRVHVSLTRVALWILSLGTFDKDYAREVAGTGTRHAYLDPETFTADTPLGRYQGVTEQIAMSATPGAYRPSSLLVPRGSGRPEWLPDHRS
ncbi:CoA transferase [Streptomyces sp. NPDC047097]|uniref:CoA transferase n=1 Tax=Streptomyces sp. NPDC047097 TaxID=3155260 RepID=UPI00340AEBB1